MYGEHFTSYISHLEVRVSAVTAWMVGNEVDFAKK